MAYFRKLLEVWLRKEKKTFNIIHPSNFNNFEQELTSEELNEISDALGSSENLTRLNIRHRMRRTDYIPIFPILNHSTTLKYLQIDDCLTPDDVSKQYMRDLANGIRVNSSLAVLELSTEHLSPVIDVLPESASIASLILNHSRISHSDVCALSAVLPQVPLVALKMSRCSIEHPSILLKAISIHSTLTKLCLENNRFGCRPDHCSCSSIAKMVATNTTLTSLNLGVNSLKHSVKLVHALKKNKTLTSLNISDNKFTQRGLGRLLTVFDHNFTIIKFKFETVYYGGVFSPYSPEISLIKSKVEKNNNNHRQKTVTLLSLLLSRIHYFKLCQPFHVKSTKRY